MCFTVTCQNAIPYIFFLYCVSNCESLHSRFYFYSLVKVRGGGAFQVFVEPISEFDFVPYQETSFWKSYDSLQHLKNVQFYQLFQEDE